MVKPSCSFTGSEGHPLTDMTPHDELEGLMRPSNMDNQAPADMLPSSISRRHPRRVSSKTQPRSNTGLEDQQFRPNSHSSTDIEESEAVLDSALESSQNSFWPKHPYLSVNEQPATPSIVHSVGQAPEKHQQLIRLHYSSDFFRPWASEILRLCFSASLLVAMFILLGRQDGKLQRDWNIPITLNSLVNLLSTLFRGTIASVAAELICQEKWNWFWSDKSSNRRMTDLQHFNDGSRGAFGALRLVTVVSWRSPSTIAAIFIITLSFAIGPFAQQAINTSERNVRDTTINASIPISRRIDDTHLVFEARDNHNKSIQVNDDHYRWQPGPRIAFYKAVWNPGDDDPSIVPDCPSGNCTFGGLESDPSDDLGHEKTYASAGICSVCTDLSSSIQVSNISNQYADVSLPNGLRINIGPGKTTLAFAFGSLNWARQKVPEDAWYMAKNHAFINITVLTATLPRTLPDQDAPTFGHRVAVSCSIYLCLRTYSSIVENTRLKETLISEKPMSLAHSQNTHFAFNTPCAVDGVNITSFPELEGQSRAYEPRFESMVSDPCIYTATDGASQLLSLLFGDLFNETCTWVSSQGGVMQCGSRFWLSGFWEEGNVTARSIIDRFSGIATSITNQFRLEFGRGGSHGFEARGHAFIRLTYFIAERQWLLFPALLFGLDAALLGWMIFKYSQSAEDRAIWKGSILPLLFYKDRFMGEEEDEDSREQRLMTTKEMMRNSGGVTVRFLRRRGDGWEDSRSLHMCVSGGSGQEG